MVVSVLGSLFRPLSADMATELDQAWNYITDLLFNDQIHPQQQHVVHALQILCANGMHLIIEPWFFEIVQQQLRSQVAPQFWSKFETPIPSDDVINHIQAVFDDTYLKLSTYWTSVKQLESIENILHNVSNAKGPTQNAEDLHQRLILLFKAILFPVFPKNTKNFQDALQQFFFKAFKAFDALSHKSEKSNKSLIHGYEGEQGSSSMIELDSSNETDGDSFNVTDSLTCIGCEEEMENCQCKHIMATFHQLNHQLRDLGLLERLGGEVVSTLIHDRIRQHVELTCKGNFETEYLGTLETWLETKVVGWLELMYGDSQGNGSDVKSPIHSEKERLLNLMYETYARIHIDQMFTIIIEYPESLPGLQDLKVCLEKVNLRGVLVQSLRQALETRLLHPGVNTTDILTAYINAIRALRVLDPSGVLLDLVCEPVRCYLRSRDDTVRCVVSSLTEDSSSELSEELMKNQSVVHDDNFHNEDDVEDWENWQPDPVDADPAKMSWNRRRSDIISMLINIYGSKELFVNEYRTILADRILTQLNYDTEKEIRYLELLKVKFGEAQLHFCEVMLKDVADSRRINAHIHEQKGGKPEPALDDEQKDIDATEEELSLSALILSAEFWPAFREEKLKLPQFMEKHLEKYTEAFEGLKGNRTLCWKPHLGQVHLEIEHKGKTLDMTVSPVHATIIWHFQEKSKWTIDELSTVMHIPTHALRRKMAYWQSNGLLKEEAADVFVLVEEVRGQNHDTDVMEEEEVESAMATAQDKKEEELNVIWQYVVGMLTNLESLPLERIYSVLKMFAIDGPGSEYTIHQLKEFLDKKVKEHKLLFSGGIFRLPKPES